MIYQMKLLNSAKVFDVPKYSLIKIGRVLQEFQANEA
eukprot:CAMPEP_0114590828 /NCGR_PEP_ID=MMETSP0125-20121206/13004_1 /TAXON_ID=485358 ORGANISM="Aristerostoma sp., Strain ATCC 50986" /NCGR_SAMPLE_ID=MMETSP0125 /ASSEMBLY_ACC=CAM_ASM_000245 /LENGTH=36 /DNA_ID= /DNA_START= /DNA_END= /DNA_ORIENTATION=